MQEQSIKVLGYELGINGLKVRYRTARGTTVVWYDAFAACALFEELSIIEGFDTDGKEPVILYEDASIKPYGWCLWCQFVRTYPFALLEAQRVAEFHFAGYKELSLQAQKKEKPTKENVMLLPRDVLPPVHLYNLHNYYYEHIRTTKRKDSPGAAS